MDQSTQLTQRKWFPYAIGAATVASIWFISSLLSNNSVGVMYSDSYDGGSYLMEDSSYSAAPMSSSKMISSDPVGNMTESRQITKNYLSVHVKSVNNLHSDITEYVKGVSGKVMSVDVSESTENESESGTMRVLVPNDKSDELMALLAEKSIKIVDKSVTSYEVSQEYTDINRSIEQLEVTYKRVLTFYNQAESVEDLISIQNQLDNVQMQIDSYKGRLSALKELSENTEYTIYSNTNEYDLPYLPDGTFQFSKTIKNAVRMFMQVLSNITSLVIYLVVFLPLILGIWALIWFAKKKQVKK